MSHRRIIARTLICASFCAAGARAEVAIHVDRPFFNATIGQKVRIELRGTGVGPLAVEVVDRDGHAIRTLASPVGTDPAIVEWDGRDDAGTVVPDEAYALRIRRDGSGETVYDPSAVMKVPAKGIDFTAYSKISGILSYTLERPSRVHIQVGQAGRATKDSPPDGPVLRTLVDEEPRTGGRVIENWNGWDETGELYIPDLPDFAVSVVAAPLPENALITVGNRKETFRAYLLRTRGHEVHVRDLSMGSHASHQGLSAIEDHSPRLVLSSATPADGSAWRVGGGSDLVLEARIEDETAAPYFLSPRAELFVYLGLNGVQKQGCSGNPCIVRIPAAQLVHGRTRLAVNWGSGFGPVAVASKWVEVQ